MIKVVGIPFEGCGNFLRGAALSPSHIRWHLWGIDRYSPYFRENMPGYEDLGDIWTNFDESAESRLKYIRKKLGDIVEPKSRYLFVGGDHTITVATVQVLREILGDFAILHLDAHLDRWDRFDGEFSHATTMRRLEEMGFKVGTFGYRTVGEQEYEPEYGSMLSLEGVGDFIDSCEKIYLSFDFDFFDPSFFPAVSNPEPMGFGFKDFIEVIMMLKGKLISAEMVEYIPNLDTSKSCGAISAIVMRELLVALYM